MSPTKAAPPAEAAKPASKESGPADPAKVCVHLLDLARPLVEARSGPLPPEKLEQFQARCVAGELGERAEGEARWACRSRCLLAAQSPDAVEACDATCPLAAPRIDCDATLTIAELGAELGGPVRPPAVESEKGGPSCARTFMLRDDHALVFSLATHRTSAGAAATVKGHEPDAEDEEPLPGVGDVAKRWRTRMGDSSACHVLLARHRVSMHLMVPQATCPWEPLARLAAKAASRLP